MLVLKYVRGEEEKNLPQKNPKRTGQLDKMQMVFKDGKKI
jgi:hypothetical protein